LKDRPESYDHLGSDQEIQKTWRDVKIFAGIKAVILSTHVQKPLLTLTASAQSKLKDDFLVPVFDFFQGVPRLVIGNRNCASPVNEIETSE